MRSAPSRRDLESFMTKESLADGATSPLHTAMGPHQRALLTGIDSLSDADLVSILLITGGGGAPLPVLAVSLLDDHGGIRGLARIGVRQLSEHRGVGLAKAVRLAAAVELGVRAAHAASLESLPQLPASGAVVAWGTPRLTILDHEELWALALDGRNGLRAARRVASGGIHGLHVGVRDVLRIVLKEAASTFILLHNHPSGDPSPSHEDVEFTRAVVEGADAVGTPLLDHVIIARQRSCSMQELGLLAPPSRRGTR
jgi:DNA repair protein RadC